MLKTTRLQLFSSVVCSYVILTGFDTAMTSAGVAANTLAETSQLPDSSDLEKPPVLPIPVQDLSKQSFTQPDQLLAVVKTSPPLTESLDALPVTKIGEPTINKEAAFSQKMLDITLPFKEGNDLELPSEKLANFPNQLNLFAMEGKKKSRRLQVDGNVIMTPEQEVEKRKSIDGAGISINLKP